MMSIIACGMKQNGQYMAGKPSTLGFIRGGGIPSFNRACRMTPYGRDIVVGSFQDTMALLDLNPYSRFQGVRHVFGRCIPCPRTHVTYASDLYCSRWAGSRVSHDRLILKPARPGSIGDASHPGGAPPPLRCGGAARGRCPSLRKGQGVLHRPPGGGTTGER